MIDKLFGKWIFKKKVTKAPKKELTATVYDSIFVLTLDKFIDCLCDNKLEVLSLPGSKATHEQLQSAWMNIYEQYADRVQDSEQKYMTRLSREINLLGTKLNLVNLIVERLGIEHNPEVLAELKRILNVPGNFDPLDQEQYKKDLQISISLSKQLFMKMKEKESELQRLMPTTQAGKIDRAHFDSLIIQLSKHLKFQVNRQQVLVSEFIAMVVDMRSAIEQFIKDKKTT